ncbi:MAG: hypothetical protein DRH12_04560 [Deltaproteobacteria bacterium]|nr:MAG: hypothetical protein DRH12_04560 [Deltaproteobacteria bacterium]
MQWIDRLNRWIAKGTAWLVPLLILELVYDTAARYIFNCPTEWSYDISYMLYGAIFMLGAAHTLAIDKHVRIETIYGKLSPKGKALMDGICYLIFYFPSVSALLYFGTKFAVRSWKMWEAGGESMWQPPIYPFKTILPIAALLLLLQGIAQFIRCANTLMGTRDVDSKS